MAGSNRFPSRIRHIQDGDPLTAGIAGSPDKTLEGRTNYLKDRLDAIEAGRALLWVDQVLAPDVKEGQPVYWNADNNRWELGLAGVEECNTSGTLETLESSDIQGMVLRKRVGNIGDIAIWGVVFYADQLANAIDGPIEPGNYYLSAVTPGKMVRQKPPVSVLCCHIFGPLDDCDANTWVYVKPIQKDFLEDHIHFAYDLVARPAGVTFPPEPADPESHHTLTDADSSLPGWLPADDPIFNGKAPAGAFFGYNFSAHEAVSRNWPPIPVCASLIEMQRINFKVAGRVHDDQVVIDKWGIWWMTDCYDMVPWPTDIDTRPTSSSSMSMSSESASSVSSSSESAQPLPCPQELDMTLKLYFIKMTFLGQKTVVTSLEPDEGQPFRFVNCDGVEAKTGSLFAQLILALLIEDDFHGGQALKGITETNKFKRGWVTEGLIAGTNLSLVSSHSRRLDPEAAAGPTNPIVHQGIVKVSTTVDSERELNPQIVVLDDSLERTYRDIQYLGLPDGRDAGFGLKFMIPPVGIPTVAKFKVRCQIFGLANGTLTDLDVAYKVLVRPTIGSPTPVIAGLTTLAMNTAIPVLANNMYEVESALIDVLPGDTVYVEISRAAAGSPSYNSEIGLHRFGGIIIDGG